MKTRCFFMMPAIVLFMAACGNRRTSPEVLQQKIDSVVALEKLRQLHLSGVGTADVSPFQQFCDSLPIQALPLRYSDDYVRYLPNFTQVPLSIMSYLELEGRVAPRAIALPDDGSSRLVLLAADLEDGEYELWLYSLDAQCYPVDKLLLYAPEVISESALQPDEQESYFSITSQREINVLEYADESDRFGQLSTFVVDDSLMFVEKRPAY